MKLSEKTIEILKNYATINPSLMFRKGSVLTTITSTKTVFATARVVESFPSDFFIGDLVKLLSKLSLYKEPILEFEPNRLIIKSADGRRTDSMVFSSPAGATIPDPNKKIALDNPEHEIDLSQEDLVWQRKSAGISSAVNIAFVGDGEKIYLQSSDLNNDASDVSSTEIGTTTDKFRYAFKFENWKLLEGSYHIKLSKGLSKFENKDKSVEYFVAVESKLSEF